MLLYGILSVLIVSLIVAILHINKILDASKILQFSSSKEEQMQKSVLPTVASTVDAIIPTDSSKYIILPNDNTLSNVDNLPDISTPENSLMNEQYDANPVETSNFSEDKIPFIHRNDVFSYVYDPKSIDVLIGNGAPVSLIQDNLGSPFDNKMTAKLKSSANHNKTAIVNRSRFTKKTLEKYFKNELKDHENRRWWDDDKLDSFM